MLRLASGYESGMVLQQNCDIRLFGMTEKEATVHLQLQKKVPVNTINPAATGKAGTPGNASWKTVFEDEEKAGKDGYFTLKLPAQEASFAEYSLTLSTTQDEIVLTDILFGEVWLALGADNMAQSVRASDLAAVAKMPQMQPRALRFLRQNPDGLSAEYPDYSMAPLAVSAGAHWFKTSALSELLDASALSYAFGLKLCQNINVPLGIILAATSGSYIHSYLPLEVLEKDPVLKNHVRELKMYRDKDNWNQENALIEAPKEDTNELFSRRRTERSQTAMLLRGHKPDVMVLEKQNIPSHVRKIASDLEIRPLRHVFRKQNQPGALFNHKIAPFLGMALRGLIVQGGEFDVDSPEYYFRAFEEMLDAYDELFNPVGGKLRVVLGELQPYLFQGTSNLMLPRFNEMLMRLKRSLEGRAGMVTTHDLNLSYDMNLNYCAALTPISKKVMGERFAEVAAGLVYGDAVNSAPELVSAELVGNKFMLSFDENAYKHGNLQLPPGDTELCGFAICGRNRVFVPCKAKIMYGVNVMCWHDEISEPYSVCYGYNTFNNKANLLGGDLPVVPFRLDIEDSCFLPYAAWCHVDELRSFSWIKSVDEDNYRLKKDLWPQYRNTWSVNAGRAEISLNAPRDIDGIKGFTLHYQRADEHIVQFGPRLDFASNYPPLDLSMYGSLTLIIGNADWRVKHLAIQMEDQNGVSYIGESLRIENGFQDQKLTWQLKDISVNREKISYLNFRLKDGGGSGRIQIYGILLHGFDERAAYAGELN